MELAHDAHDRCQPECTQGRYSEAKLDPARTCRIGWADTIECAREKRLRVDEEKKEKVGSRLSGGPYRREIKGGKVWIASKATPKEGHNVKLDLGQSTGRSCRPMQAEGAN